MEEDAPVSAFLHMRETNTLASSKNHITSD